MAERDDRQGSPGSAATLIFPCSGATDVGEVADRAGRQLAPQGVGKMASPAGIGGKVERFVAAAKAASHVLVIDGCEVDCARKTLEEVGLKDFKHIRVTDLDMEEGRARVTDVHVNKVVERAKKELGS